MKAVLWRGRQDIRLEDVPEPSPQRGDIKDKLKWRRICGTDVGQCLHGPILMKNLPVILCHEYSAELLEVGER